MNSFKDKNVWVIGASSGIGADLCRELAKQGANLILSARNEDKLKEVKETLSEGNHNVFKLDVTEIKNVEKTTKAIFASYGTIDSIIFMAATYSSEKPNKQSIEVINKIVDVNLKGAINVVFYSLPLLKKQKESQLVICGSVAGYRGLPNGQPYCATKAALINYTESLRMENIDDGVDVRLISPGFVKTDLTDKNDFKMPFIIESEDAAKRIVKGLKSNSFEIHFPKRFTLMLKFLQLFPNWLYLKTVKNIR